MEINWINAIGLICDIIGFALIYFAGTDADFFKQQRSSMKKNEKENPNMHQLAKWDDKSERNKYIKMSNWGFKLVILGFLLQFSSLFCKEIPSISKCVPNCDARPN